MVEEKSTGNIPRISGQELENKKDKEWGVWVGDDVEFSFTKQESPVSLRGQIKVPSAYFFSLPDNNHALNPELSVRSKLMQAGITPYFFDRPVKNEKGEFLLEVFILSRSGKPLVEVPDKMLLGRYFVRNYGTDVSDEEIARAGREIPDHLIPAGVASSAFYPEIPFYKTGAIKVVTLPVKKYFTIGTDNINVADVVNSKQRDDLNNILQITEVDKAGVSHKREGYFYLGETVPVKVPDDETWIIQTELGNGSSHMPSVVIDAGFGRGAGKPIRLEFSSEVGKVAEVVNFSAYPS